MASDLVGDADGLTDLIVAGPSLGPAVAECEPGDQVTMHIIGGMKVSGSFIGYDEENGVATVRDDRRRNFEIDVHSVAVLET